MTERISLPHDRTRPAGSQFVPNARVAVSAILRRDAGERRVLGMGFVLDFAFGIVNLTVFAFVSRTLRSAHGHLGGAASYFDFVAVGITFMLVIQAAGTQITSRVQEEQRSGSLELLAARPVASAVIAVGLSAYPMLLAVARAAAYLVVASLLLGLEVGAADWLGLAVMLGLGGIAMMGVGIALAAVSVAVEHGDALGRVVVVAIAFGSGTYFPTSVLPPVLRWFTVPLPTRIALDGLRAALAGGSWIGSAMVLAAAAGVGLLASLWMFDHALRFAVRRGTLTRG